MMHPKGAPSLYRKASVGGGQWRRLPFFMSLIFILVSPVTSGLGELDRLRELVERDTVCALPGCPMKLDRFVPLLRRAMSRGFVSDIYGEYVLKGFTQGFDLGVQFEALRGQRVFRNYPAAFRLAPSAMTTGSFMTYLSSTSAVAIIPTMGFQKTVSSAPMPVAAAP